MFESIYGNRPNVDIVVTKKIQKNKNNITRERIIENRKNNTWTLLRAIEMTILAIVG